MGYVQGAILTEGSIGTIIYLLKKEKIYSLSYIIMDLD